MDKDSIILKYDQLEVDNIAQEINGLDRANSDQKEALEEMQEKINSLYASINRSPTPTSVEAISDIDMFEAASDSYTEVKTYDELFEHAKSSLINRGLDIETLDYKELVSEEELKELVDEMNRPLSERERWEKGDFIVVFISAAIGSLADIVLGDRSNDLTGDKSSFSSWLNKFHKHESGAPIDYQGEGFGGGFHRGLSKGHDLLRFIEAVFMFKNGQFEGIRYVNGEAIKVVSKLNQLENPYEQLSLIDALIRYTKHMVADLFSTCSLPFPGHSFLVEADNRQLRKFAVDMYQNGFNCKNVLVQGLSTAIIEIILRVYYSIKSVKKMENNLDISEDYSNWEKIKEFITPHNQEKLNEMMLVAHSIVTAVSIGKIVVKKAPWEINITEIISVVKYGIRVVNANEARHSEYGKLIRNEEELHRKWGELEAQITGLDKETIMEMPEGTLVIA